MLRKLYIKTDKSAKCNINKSYDTSYLLHLFNITFKTLDKYSAPVLKYHGDVMMRCPEGDYSAIKRDWSETRLHALLFAHWRNDISVRYIYCLIFL